MLPLLTASSYIKRPYAGTPLCVFSYNIPPRAPYLTTPEFPHLLICIIATVARPISAGGSHCADLHALGERERKRQRETERDRERQREKKREEFLNIPKTPLP